MYNIQKRIYILAFVFVLFLAKAVSSPMSGVLIVAGPPGSGKGYLANFFVDKYSFGHISAGDLLREEVSKKTPLGESIANIIKDGNPVKNEVMHTLLKSKVTEEKSKHSFLIIDGFGGQSGEDAPFLQNLLKQIDLFDRTIVVFLESTDEECQKRMAGRLICSTCSRIYNINTSKPKKENFCDFCDQPLIQRPQDTEGTIQKRITRYRDVMKDNYSKFSSIFPYIKFDVDHEDCIEFYKKLAAAIQKLPDIAGSEFIKMPEK
jgi:adenylate kinase